MLCFSVHVVLQTFTFCSYVWLAAYKMRGSLSRNKPIVLKNAKELNGWQAFTIQWNPNHSLPLHSHLLITRIGVHAPSQTHMSI